MIDAAIGRYQITAQLGAGGMGVVYRARDTKLNRDVALKMLPPGLLEDERARRRFRKEALALSRLNHPNIATIHDFDSSGGMDFIVMELVDGPSLETRAGHVLSDEELLSVGTQMADGLAGAHSAGVLHLDLKPANLRMTPDGRLKILDFGLATLLHGDASTAALSATEEKSTGGTLPYMAPEQFSGKADERTDIYQAGAVLYELATGRRAFGETQPAALINAILHSTPQLPRALNAALSADFDPILMKAIDKDPALRYQSARELAIDLQRMRGSSSRVAVRPPEKTRWGLPIAAGSAAVLALAGGLFWFAHRSPAAPGNTPPSIAVLPFVNQSTDRTNDFFSDAMAYEIITQLGKISDLRVTSRTSVARYRGSQKQVREVASELGVTRIVEGAVMRSGQRVRVDVSLIDALADRQVWSESYERDLTDTLALQSDIARAVASEVQARVLPHEAARLAPKRHVDPRGEDAYLRGLYEQINMPMNPMMAQQHFQRAIQIDPGYAAPYAGLAESFVQIGFFVHPIAPMIVFPKISDLAAKAAALDDSNASAHTSLAVAHLHGAWKWAAAEAEFKRAIELNPSWAPAHHWYAHLLLALDRTNESVAESERASQLDPDNIMWGSCVGWHCLYARKYDDAISHLKNVIAHAPKQFLAYLYLGRAYEATGRLPEAISAFKTSANLSMGSATVLAALAHAHGRAGDRASANQILNDLMARSRTEYVSAYDIAVIYAGLGERDEAFVWLDKAFTERSAWLAHIKWDERFAELRGDARFTSLVRRIGLPV